jgi:hypothetical protein
MYSNMLSLEPRPKAVCVAIAPGERMFLTCYSDNELVVASDDFAQGMLFPLIKKTDKVFSQRQRVLSQLPKITKCMVCHNRCKKMNGCETCIIALLVNWLPPTASFPAYV